MSIFADIAAIQKRDEQIDDLRAESIRLRDLVRRAIVQNYWLYTAEWLAWDREARRELGMPEREGIE